MYHDMCFGIGQLITTILVSTGAKLLSSICDNSITHLQTYKKIRKRFDENYENHITCYHMLAYMFTYCYQSRNAGAQLVGRRRLTYRGSLGGRAPGKQIL